MIGMMDHRDEAISDAGSPGFGVSEGDAVLRVRGDIDSATAPSLEQALSGRSGVVCIDMSDVSFMDSAGAHVIIKTAKRVGDNGCVILHGSSPHVAKVFQVLGLVDRMDSLHVLDGHGVS